MVRRNEAVTASFHFFAREHKAEGAKPRRVPFKPEEFDALAASLQRRPTINLSNARDKESLQFRQVVPIEQVVRVDPRTVFGVFKAAYWGHSYENSHRGEIPADSISLRPFHFLVYLSESGRLYIGSQYLGQFGGYTGLSRTLTSLLPDPESINAHSYRLPASYYREAQAKEVRVSISKNSGDIARPNVFQSGATIGFKKQEKNDGFEKAVADALLSLVGQPQAVVRSAVARLLRENELFAAEDKDIDDCTVVALVNGKRKVIHMIETGQFATRFPLDVQLNQKGHPMYEPTKTEMIKVLRNEIISRSEDV